jgi:RNA polymerase sigma factor (sigma-70 family)
MQSVQLTKNWNLLVEGDKQGLYECFNLFYDDLYRFGLSLYKDPELIKDSIQNLFIELWDMRDKLADVKNIKPYVFTIFKRIIYKTNKNLDQNNLGLEIALEDINEDVLTQNSYEAILVESQTDEYQRKLLYHALNTLSPRQKEIIQLKYFEKQSYEEISNKTSLTERTIYNTLHNALKILRKSSFFFTKTG